MSDRPSLGVGQRLLLRIAQLVIVVSVAALVAAALPSRHAEGSPSVWALVVSVPAGVFVGVLAALNYRPHIERVLTGQRWREPEQRR
ncbi:MAG: hypothetical protein SF182_04365 [Deltaproteobacteria bacterium]|nr:hypothetical protein [Deltaproteobacteria bacterium]